MSTDTPDTATSLFQHFNVQEPSHVRAAEARKRLVTEAGGVAHAAMPPGLASPPIEYEAAPIEVAVAISARATRDTGNIDTEELSAAAAAAPEEDDTAPKAALEGGVGAVPVPEVTVTRSGTDALPLVEDSMGRPTGNDIGGPGMGGVDGIGPVPPVEENAAGAHKAPNDAEREAEIRQIRKSRHDAKMAAKRANKPAGRAATVLAKLTNAETGAVVPVEDIAARYRKPAYYTVKDLAARYQVDPSTIWRWVAESLTFPKPVKIEGSTRWSVSAIEAYERARERS